MADANTVVMILLCCLLPIYFLVYLVLNARWDRARIGAEVKARGGTNLCITRTPGDWFGASAREYDVRYVDPDGAARHRVAVTSFWMGVAWRDPRPLPG